MLAIEPYLCTRVNTTKVDDGALLVPTFWQVKATMVCTYWIDGIVLATIVESRTSLDERRSIAMRIFYVAIDGAVIALHLPTRRNGDSIGLTSGTTLGHSQCCLEGRYVHCLYIASHLTLFWYLGEPEVPCAIQALVQSALGLCPGSSIVSLVGLHLCLTGIRHIRCYARQLVDGKDGFVFPDRRRKFGLLHLLDGEPGSLVSIVDVSYLHHIALCTEHLLLVGRNDTINATLTLDGFDAHQGIAWIGRVGGPLKKP